MWEQDARRWKNLPHPGRSYGCPGVRKRIAAAGAGVGIALALPVSAAAHATLLRSSPADRSVLTIAPHTVRFFFDDTVRVASGIRAVRNGGASVLAGQPYVGGSKTLVVPLQKIGEGDYTVLWRIVSDDGHTEAGVISFAVGTGRSPPLPSLSASSGPTPRDVISRWLFFAGLFVASGSALFRLATGAGHSSIALPGFVAAFLGASGLLPHEGTFSTRFGIAYAIATLVTAIGATTAAVALVEARAAAVAWVCGLLLLPLPSIAGHALDAGQPRIEVGVDVLHLASAAVWTGGLVQLVFALRSGARADLARRFSTLALVAVAVLSATGVIRALAELRSVSQLGTTGYGRLLIVKTGLLAVLVGIGWLNRYRLIPRGDTATLRRSTAGELVLIAGLVVAVSILTDVRPGKAHPETRITATSAPLLPPRNAVVLAQEDGDNGVTLAATPNRIVVTVFDGEGLGVDGLGVSVAGTQAARCGPGCYATQTRVRGRVAVVVDGRVHVFDLSRVAPDATALMARASGVFHSLRSVSYVERLASSVRNRIVSTFTLEAPDRVEYTIRGGAAGIVIGTSRWDRTDGRWVPSSSTLLPQPTPIWGTPITNAHVLARTRAVVTVSFINRRVPAWFLVRFDARTLRPRSLEMTATAHFMHHVYRAFNAPRRIFPPR
jgi:copper transport protein